MEFNEIIPREKLRPYIKCYWVLDSGTDAALEDTLFPSGYMEIVFNLGEAVWKSEVKGQFHTSPPVELMGQITRPLAIQSSGKNVMLGIRFFAHTAAYFFREDVFEFNDQISDGGYLLGDPVNVLHAKLMDTPALHARIELIEQFLLNRLAATRRPPARLAMIGQVVEDMKRSAFSVPVETVAARYNISPRYLQKLFLQHIGVTPKLYNQINRFHGSLRYINSNQAASLTSVAYHCGYFDQSHFIREFKSFAGVTPSACLPGQHPTLLIRCSPNS